jgi:hypothetical protein
MKFARQTRQHKRANNAHLPQEPIGTYGYMGKFCIVATATGERKIIAIGSDTPAWKQDSCPEHSLIR